MHSDYSQQCGSHSGVGTCRATGLKVGDRMGRGLFNHVLAIRGSLLIRCVADIQVAPVHAATLTCSSSCNIWSSVLDQVFVIFPISSY